MSTRRLVARAKAKKAHLRRWPVGTLATATWIDNPIFDTLYQVTSRSTNTLTLSKKDHSPGPAKLELRTLDGEIFLDQHNARVNLMNAD